MQSWLRLALDIENFEMVTPLPLYHIFPLGMTLMALASGAHNRLVVNPRDTQALCDELQRAPFDMLIGVNTMFNAMVTSPETLEARLLPLPPGHRRRRLDPGGRRREVGGGRRPAHHRSLWAH